MKNLYPQETLKLVSVMSVFGGRVYPAAQRKLLLIDQDALHFKQLQMDLHAYDFHAYCSDCGDVLPTLLERRQDRIDIVVMDVMLTGKDGFYWLQWLQQYHAYIPVVITAKQAGQKERLLGLQYGARDFISKPFYNKELLIRIENILGQQQVTLHGNKKLVIGDVWVNIAEHYVVRDSQQIALTQLELKILKLLYLNLNVAVSRAEIMEGVRGTKFNPLDRSIDIHVNKLRKKIEHDPSNPVYIRTIRGKGYSLFLPPETA